MSLVEGEDYNGSPQLVLQARAFRREDTIDKLFSACWSSLICGLGGLQLDDCPVSATRVDLPDPVSHVLPQTGTEAHILDPINDLCKEFLAVLTRIVEILSISHMVTESYREPLLTLYQILVVQFIS